MVDDPKLAVSLVWIGKRIAVLRKKKGYSQEGFAAYCGVHRTFMGAIERGESNLSLSTMLKVAKHLEVTVAELLKGMPVQ